MRLLAALVILFASLSAAAVELTPLKGGPYTVDRMAFYATHPAQPLPDGTWLVVALHGCHQDGRDYFAKSGWAEMAAARPMAVLAPEFTGRWSNPAHCWEWWEEDEARGRPGSMAHALAEAIAAYRTSLGPGPTFVTGLSAGAAMAQVLVSVWPDRFTAQASVAGVPYGCSLFGGGYDTSCKDDGSCRLKMRHFLDPFPYPRFTEAASCMENGYDALPDSWRKLLPGGGPWPPALIVQGAVDPTVDCVNAREMAEQWSAALGVEAPRPACDPSLPVFSDGIARGRVDKDGKPAVVVLTLRDLGHAQPVTPDCGRRDPEAYYAGATICAAAEAVQFFDEVMGR